MFMQNKHNISAPGPAQGCRQAGRQAGRQACIAALQGPNTSPLPTVLRAEKKEKTLALFVHMCIYACRDVCLQVSSVRQALKGRLESLAAAHCSLSRPAPVVKCVCVCVCVCL